jgi:hypothetical protein
MRRCLVNSAGHSRFCFRRARAVSPLSLVKAGCAIRAELSVSLARLSFRKDLIAIQLAIQLPPLLRPLVSRILLQGSRKQPIKQQGGSRAPFLLPPIFRRGPEYHGCRGCKKRGQETHSVTKCVKEICLLSSDEQHVLREYFRWSQEILWAEKRGKYSASSSWTLGCSV